MHQKLPQNGTKYRKNGTKYRKISCEKAQNSPQNRTEFCSIQTDSAAGKAQGKDSAFTSKMQLESNFAIAGDA